MEIKIGEFLLELKVPDKSKVLIFPLENGKIEVTIEEKEGE